MISENCLRKYVSENCRLMTSFRIHVDMTPALRLHRIDPDRNMARYYELSVEPTLFGDYAAVRCWGRIGSGGQARETWCRSLAEAAAAVARLAEAKRRRGYVQTTPTA